MNRLIQCGVDRRRIEEQNISEMDLSGQNLAAVDLKGFLIIKVNLENSDLSGADLRGLEFAQSNCVCARFMGADFRGARLAFGYFNNADFSGADFRGAHLENALCSECIFTGGDFRGAHLGSEHYNSDFRGTDLRGIVVPPESDFSKLNCDTSGALITPPRININVSNKRILPRIRPEQQLSVFERTSKRQIGIVIDISMDGIKIATQSQIQSNILIGIEIPLPDGDQHTQSLSIDIRSVWSSPQQGTVWFNTGFKIERISDQHRSVIQALIKKQEILH
jgi:uncharacterized protein YjbI with pentapeptide repeats